MTIKRATCQIEDLPSDSSPVYVWHPIALVKRIRLSLTLRRALALFHREKIQQPLPTVLELKPGEFVEVRSEEEILATLDKNGKFQGLTFLPEMFQFCGKTFRVFKRLEKMIVEGKGLRKIKNTVLLEKAICDGEAHGGCDRSCFCMWREAWLKRAE